MRKLSMIIAVLGMMISPMMQLQAQQDVQDSVIGIWINTVDSSAIEIYEDHDTFFGKIIKIKMPKDSIIVNNCKFNANLKVWDKGSYYDYTNGTTYSKCVMSFNDIKKPDTLRIDVDTPAPQAPVGGKTTYWTRKKSSTNTD